MERIEYGTDGYPYVLSMSTSIANNEQFPTVKADTYTKEEVIDMLKELEYAIADKNVEAIKNFDYGFNCGLDLSIGEIRDRINDMRGEENGKVD